MPDILRGLIILAKFAAGLIGILLGLWLLYLIVFVGIPFLFIGGLAACYNVYENHAGKIWIGILTLLLLLIAKSVGKASRG